MFYYESLLLKKNIIDHRLLENFSWPLLLTAVALSVCGLFNLYSISSQGNFVEELSWFWRQFLYFGVALVALVAILFVDYQYLRKIIWPIYALGMISLIAVMFFGETANGATSWLELGSFRFQPSEMMKVVVVVALAAWFTSCDLSAGLGFKELAGAAVLIFAPFVFIFKQPDLGTALHLLATCAPLFLLLKWRRNLLFALVFVGIICSGALIALVVSGSWDILLEKGLIKPHQVNRLATFVDPDSDPSGSGWQIIQSQNAVGGGQLMGRGFMEGTQHKNGFLPEAETDFAFAALAEEWGFVGALFVLSLFLFLMFVSLSLARRSKDRFGSLIAFGLTSLIFWQVVINIGMVTGLLPVVGIPLPFISYGGTSLLTVLVAVGFILNIGMRRFRFQEDPIEENPYVWQEEADLLRVENNLSTVRRLSLDTPFNPEVHPSYRLPHVRPWVKYLRKGRSSISTWQTPGWHDEQR